MQMNDVQIDIRLEGEKFSPAKFMEVSQIPLEVIAEAGAPALRGRYKGKASPYGMALWRVEQEEEDKSDISRILFQNLNRLWQLKGEFDNVGIEEIIVDIDAPREISLNHDTLSLISKLNAKVDFNATSEYEYDQTIREIVEFIAVRLENDEQAKEALFSERANQMIKTLLGNETSNIKKRKNRAIRYLLFYLSKSEDNKPIGLLDVKEVLK